MYPLRLTLPVVGAGSVGGRMSRYKLGYFVGSHARVQVPSQLHVGVPRFRRTRGRRSPQMRTRVFLTLAATSLSMPLRGQATAPSTSINPTTLPRLAAVDERYQSYNVEMAEVIGGNFWKPYDKNTLATLRTRANAASEGGGSGGSAPAKVGVDTAIYQARPPVNLTNARLRKLAAALGPAYVRVSGSWANSVYFHDSDSPAPRKAPTGFEGVLTRAQWKGVIDFAKAVNADLVTSFAISAGVRDANGVWTPVEARKLIAFTDAAGGHISAAEMFNEPNMPTYAGAPRGYGAADYAKDLAVFEPFIRSAAPDMRIVGPGSVGEGILMPLLGKSFMDRKS